MTAWCLQDPLYNPLLDALEAGHEQIASLLLDHGANVCLRQVCVVVDGHNVGILPGLAASIKTHGGGCSSGTLSVQGTRMTA